jgi:hypothetical protein
LLAELGYSDMVAGPWKVVGDNAQAGLCDLLECICVFAMLRASSSFTAGAVP